MKIVLAGYQTISLIHGGPNVQLRQTLSELRKLGVDAKFFNSWENFSNSDCNIFHLFAANIGTYHTAKNIFEHKIPLAVSPIFYTRRSPAYIRTTASIVNFLNKAYKGVWIPYTITQEICSAADAILPNTKDEGNLLSEGLCIPKEKITIVPNGVEPRF